jgi:hypothetical protein
LWTARGSVSTLMPAMRAVAMTRAAAALEASTSAIRTTIGTTIGTAISAARPVEASTPTAVAATIPSAALRPLESRARIAADARGITANKFFARSVGVARSASFAGKKNHIFLDDGFRGLTLLGKGSVGFGFHAGYELIRAMAVVLLRFVVGFVPGFVFGIMFDVQIGFGSFDGFLVFALGFVFGIFARALGFLVLGVFAIFFFAEMLVCFVSFFFLFVEGCATSQSVGFGARLCFLMLGFDETSGKRGKLLFIERGRAAVSGLRYRWFFMMFFNRSGDGLGGFGRSGSSNFLGRCGLRRVGLGVSQDPVRQAAGETAAYTGATLRQTNGRAASWLLKIGLALFGLLFAHGFYGRRHGTAAIFGERFARENDIVLDLVHGSAGDTIVGATIIVAARIAVTLRRCIF